MRIKVKIVPLEEGEPCEAQLTQQSSHAAPLHVALVAGAVRKVAQMARDDFHGGRI